MLLQCFYKGLDTVGDGRPPAAMLLQCYMSAWATMLPVCPQGAPAEADRLETDELIVCADGRFVKGVGFSRSKLQNAGNVGLFGRDMSASQIPEMLHVIMHVVLILCMLLLLGWHLE